MANEPNNAEEQLKQYAEDRRQMVPQEIHPATRNLLQGEVARTYGTQREKPAPMRLRWLPALAWILVLAAIPLFFMPRSPETKKAQESTPGKENEVVLPTQSKPGEAPIQLSDTATPVVAPVVTPPEIAAAPEAKKAKEPAPSREELAAAADRNETVLRVNGRNSVSQKMETRQISATGASTAADTAKNQRLSFVNNVATPHALNNFRIEQVGARFNVVDSDGSVYPGRETTNGGFFVAGVNNVLKQTVIFTGQVTVANSRVSNLNQQQQPTQNTANSGAQNVQNQSLFNNTANVSQEMRLQGQATVGGVQYKIDAQATPAQ